MSGASPRPRVSFGAFDLDPASGELRKHGIRIKLHEKPFQLLLALLEHAGEVATRKELQERLWPHDTIVEFENGLNNAISRLREALGDTVENPRFIETVPRHGYRFLADVSRPAPAPASIPSKRWIQALLLALGTLVVFGVVFRLPARTPKPIQSLAVLPFRNLGPGAADDYFAEGITDAITTQLAKTGVPKVISETSVAQFKDTQKPVPEIARMLDVDAVVEGAVLREGDQVRITVQLIRADTDRHVWADSYQRRLADMLALQDDVASGVADAIKLKLSPDAARRPASSKHVNPAAYEAYLKGRYFMQTPESYQRAKDYFQQAIQLDPTYSSAYAGLSDFYVFAQDFLPNEAQSEALLKAREYAQQALRLDPDLPDSHSSLAYVYFYVDWNWPAADQEFNRAIALGPGFARSHRWYAIYLTALGRGAGAMSQAQRAVDLDPLSISAHDAVAIAAVCFGHFDRAIEEARKILDLDSNDTRGYADLAIAHFQKGMYQDALQDAEKGLYLSHRDPFLLSIAAMIHGRLGQVEQASKLVEEMRAARRKRFVSPYFFATAFVGMGRPKQALDALEEGYKVRDGYMVGLYATPWFSPLRSDPRFQDLLQRMNFPR
jgi:TolB-like protein/DNA-binding winged helix-turn-helix (wHTH) protein/Tfp pilus assembly protein PilF